MNYVDRHLATFGRAVLVDALTAVVDRQAADWRQCAIELRAARRTPQGDESEPDLEAMRLAWVELTEKAKACDAKADVTRRYGIKDLLLDLVAVEAEDNDLNAAAA